jgi:hypothetical protein
MLQHAHKNLISQAIKKAGFLLVENTIKRKRGDSGTMGRSMMASIMNGKISAIPRGPNYNEVNLQLTLWIMSRGSIPRH